MSMLISSNACNLKTYFSSTCRNNVIKRDVQFTGKWKEWAEKCNKFCIKINLYNFILRVCRRSKAHTHTSPIRSKITHQTSRQANKQATAALSSCEASSMKINKNLQLFCMPYFACLQFFMVVFVCYSHLMINQHARLNKEGRI